MQKITAKPGGRILVIYGSGYMNTSSMVQSWTGLVVGILIDKGYIESVDDLVAEYLPDWQAGVKNKVTIEHLLTMTAGIDRRRGSQGILAEKDERLSPQFYPGHTARDPLWLFQ